MVIAVLRLPTATVPSFTFLNLPHKRVLSKLLGVRFKLADDRRIRRLDPKLALDPIQRRHVVSPFCLPYGRTRCPTLRSCGSCFGQPGHIPCFEQRHRFSSSGAANAASAGPQTSAQTSSPFTTASSPASAHQAGRTGCSRDARMSDGRSDRESQRQRAEERPGLPLQRRRRERSRHASSDREIAPRTRRDLSRRDDVPAATRARVERPHSDRAEFAQPLGVLKRQRLRCLEQPVGGRGAARNRQRAHAASASRAATAVRALSICVRNHSASPSCAATDSATGSRTPSTSARSSSSPISAA